MDRDLKKKLDERLVAGEITQEEYEDLLDTLRENRSQSEKTVPPAPNPHPRPERTANDNSSRARKKKDFWAGAPFAAAIVFMLIFKSCQSRCSQEKRDREFQEMIEQSKRDGTFLR